MAVGKGEASHLYTTVVLLKASPGMIPELAKRTPPQPTIKIPRASKPMDFMFDLVDRESRKGIMEAPITIMDIPRGVALKMRVALI